MVSVSVKNGTDLGEEGHEEREREGGLYFCLLSGCVRVRWRSSGIEVGVKRVTCRRKRRRAGAKQDRGGRKKTHGS